eukprot:gene11283-15136_t
MLVKQFQQFFQLNNEESNQQDIITDCYKVFNAKEISKSDDYSTGQVFFIHSNATPRCTLETMAQKIFQQHTQGLSFDPANSGAEWWTQVIDYRDDIGYHWDRDYGLEEDGIHKYPLYGTVTYLSKCGGPTIVTNLTGTENSNQLVEGNVKEFCLCSPNLFSHLLFDGSLLHAASSDFILEDDDDEDSISSNEVMKRVTFLVNIWINHVPSQAINLPQITADELSNIHGIDISCENESIQQNNMNLSKEICSRNLEWKFVSSEQRLLITLPFVDSSKANDFWSKK